MVNDGKIRRRKDIGVKSWEFGVKAGDFKETEGQKRPNYIVKQ